MLSILDIIFIFIRTINKNDKNLIRFQINIMCIYL